MAAEPSSIVERIKQKLDIVDEIGAVVALKKSGKAFKGLCPFHGERTPSFYVFPETATWRCFGCNEGGDLFSFVEKQQGLDFREALVILAERAGIALAEGGGSEGGSGGPSPETSARKRLRALNEAAAIWFHAQLLQAGAAQYARSYLASRGVSNESIALWRLGYAPDGDALARYLQDQGYSVQEIVEAGLARTRQGEAGRSGGLYDYFRNRLIFPIRDTRGQTIAFGGRELGGGHPKYLNTPQTLLFDKSATLFGLDLARDAIRRQNRVVIVEGYMDAIVPHQYGSRNVVAVIGSAITEKHIHQLKKLTRRVTLALDPDAAGESATVRGIFVAQEAFEKVAVPVAGQQDWALARGSPLQKVRGAVRLEDQLDAEITVARLPAGEDPDEFVRRDPTGWRRAIDEAIPLFDFFFLTETADLPLNTPHGKVEACQRILPVIATVRDRKLAGAYVGRLAVKLLLNQAELEYEVNQLRQKLDREARAKTPRPPARSESQVVASEQAVQSTKEDGAIGVKSQSLPAEEASARYSSPSAAPFLMPTAAMGGLLVELAQEEYCVGLLLEYPATWLEMRAILDESDFAGTETRALFAAIVAALRAADDVTVTALDDVVQGLDPLLLETAERARARAAATTTGGTTTGGTTGGAATDGDESSQISGEEEGPGLMKRASQAAYRLKRMRLKAEQAQLDYLMRDAEVSGDKEALAALLRRKQHLLTQRHTIDEATSLQA